MKYFAIAIGFLFMAQNVNSQLTNAEVFDFEIGDVFQVKYVGAGAGYTVYIDTIIGKEYSPMLDTIFYTIDRLIYNPYLVTFNESIIVQEVTNLTSIAQHFTYNTCLPATDSSFAGSCSEDIWRLHSNADQSCFEPPTWYSDLKRGLGGPYRYLYDPSSGSFNAYNKTLIYYNSAQYGECGTQQSYIGIDEQSLFQINISPNPVQNQTTIYFDDFISKDYQLELYSLSGRKVLSELILSGCKQYILNCETVQSGTYILKVNGESSSLEKRIVIE